MIFFKHIFLQFLALVVDLAQYLGLWLGFSAMTFFEIVQLILSLCSYGLSPALPNGPYDDY